MITRQLTTAVERLESSPLVRKSSKYLCTAPIVLREAPSLESRRVGIIDEGEEFTTDEIVTFSPVTNTIQYVDAMPLDESCYMNVGNGRGWALNRHVATNEYCVQSISDDPKWTAQILNSLNNMFRSRIFEKFLMAIVVLNAIIIAIDIEDTTVNFEAINDTFALIYVVELILKLVSFGPRLYFASMWNTMDCTVTCVTLLCDLPFVEHFSVVSDTAPVLRTLRLIRLMKGVRELRLLLKSFLLSISALIWIVVFASLCFFISACITTVFLGESKWIPDDAWPGAPQFRKKFDSISMSMYTLFEVMLMEGWTDVVRPLVHHRPYWVFLFILFIFMATFFLLNLVTAVVVNRTLEAQQKDRDLKGIAEVDQREHCFAILVAELMQRSTQKDRVPRAELSKWLAEAGIRHILHTLGYDSEFLESTCAILDKANTGTVSLGALIQAVKGVTSPLDMVALHRTHADMTMRMERQELILRALIEGKTKGLGCFPNP